MYDIEYAAEAAAEVEGLRARERVWILEEVDRHLAVAPLNVSRKMKLLVRPEGGFIRQLRVGDFRVFYDVDEESEVVIVRGVRRKGRKTTGEIL